VEAALVRVDGYMKDSLKADVSKEEATIQYDAKKTNPEELAKAVTDNTDFEASVPKG
jgi:copper chaperone CopZ